MSSAETQASSQKPSPLFSLETLSDLRISVILILQKEFWYQIILSQSEGVRSFKRENGFTLRTQDCPLSSSE